MGVTIDAYKTELLHALFIYAHSHDQGFGIQKLKKFGAHRIGRS